MLVDVFLSGDVLTVSFAGSNVILALLVAVVGSWTGMVLGEPQHQRPACCFIP